ncbi:hypothetical protein HCN44_006423 [Aphidius gifuensis]|uniref:Small ribosomal subunit protein mS39 n=1 Tax=Aphidius gifuensis TaxID=684658 RepID=A0A834XZU9_APHGI|nr:protein PTCD3 homolog, mitochondrial [Aphidius gifuensis]KAF7995316.1 hypothetical protein HCN44_006423 [Aphidius gifuensis]
MNTLVWKISNSIGVQRRILTNLQTSCAITTTTSFSTTTTTNNIDDIKIPLRKERGPTDVLCALEKTIVRDPTAPKYKYHDDPYLIPYSNSQKRTFALSQESGRKTAMWIRQEHSYLFNHRIADPVINEYLPKAIYDNKDDVSEDVLKKVIENGHVNDALNIYKLLDDNDNKTTISIDTKQSLFELLCYYNSQDDLCDNENLYEEKWFTQSENDKFKKWNNCDVTEKLFAFLTNDENFNNDKKIIDKAYNTMICATAKYNKFEKSFGLFEQAINNNINLSILTYNSIISIIPSLKDGINEKKSLLIDILERINKCGIKPTIGTLNSSLKVATTLSNHAVAKELCCSLFSEFNNINIEPSLASYNYALQIYYRNGATPSLLLDEIIHKLELNNDKNIKLQIKDKSDIYFFVTAMNIACNTLNNSILGDRIHKLLLDHENYNFIGDALKENVYYRNYFSLQIKNKKIDEFISSYYDLLVPHIYTPEPSVMDEILNSINSNDPDTSRKLLPTIWSHIVLFEQLERKNLVEKALNTMVNHCKPLKNDDTTNEIFGEAGWTVWNYVNTQKQRRMQNMNWTGIILGDIAVLCLRANKYDRCSLIISYLLNEQNQIIGTLHVNQINEIFDECILNCQITSALDLIKYCVDTGFEDNISSMAHKIHHNLPLANHEKKRLESIVGPKFVFNVAESNK